MLALNKTLLTGGNGFIGKNILESAQPQSDISAPTRRELDLTNSDAVDQFFQDKNYNCIIHAASTAVSRKSTTDPLISLDANLRAFMNIFKQHNKYQRLISLGSGAEYSRPTPHYQIQEAEFGKKIPQDAYGFAKLLCSKMTETLDPSKAVTLHLFGVFGPHEDYQVRFISNAIVRTLFGLPIIMNQNVEFDYVYIADFIRILQIFMTHTPRHSHYNITTGQPVTLVEIAETIRDTLCGTQDIIIKQPGLGNSYTGGNTRLRDFIGQDFQFTSLKQSIIELAAWYEKRLPMLNKEWVMNTF